MKYCVDSCGVFVYDVRQLISGASSGHRCKTKRLPEMNWRIYYDMFSGLSSEYHRLLGEANLWHFESQGTKVRKEAQK